MHSENMDRVSEWYKGRESEIWECIMIQWNIWKGEREKKKKIRKTHYVWTNIMILEPFSELFLSFQNNSLSIFLSGNAIRKGWSVTGEGTDMIYNIPSSRNRSIMFTLCMYTHTARAGLSIWFEHSGIITKGTNIPLNPYKCIKERERHKCSKWYLISNGHAGIERSLIGLWYF